MTSFRWNGDELKRQVEAGIAAGLARSAIRLQTEMINKLSGKSPSAPGTPPGVDRGTLRRSITYAMGKRSVRVGTPLKYGWFQEFGATIRPRRVKALPVPVNAAARRMMRTLPINPRTGMVGSLRSKNLTFIKSRKGKNVGLLVEKIGTRCKAKGKFSVAVLVLKPQVVLPPRPWVRRSYTACKSELPTIMADQLAKATGIRWTVTS